MDQDNKLPEENSQPDESAEQQPKPMGRHDESAKADMPVFKPNGRPWVLRTFIIAIMVLLLVLAGLFGWLWWQERNDDKKEDTSAQTTPPGSNEPEQTANECPENFTIYANDSLGIEFCYPTTWGKVEVGDAKFATEDTGTRWRLSFTEKSQVNLGLVSEDWSTTVARDGTCVDPAVQVLPEFSPFSTEWNVEIEIDTSPPQPSSATRGVEKEDGKFLIEEHVDDLLTSGVCLNGYAIIDNETYPHATASYYAEFNATISTPQQHMDDPDVLIPATDRADFAIFVKSTKAYGG